MDSFAESNKDFVLKLKFAGRDGKPVLLVLTRVGIIQYNLPEKDEEVLVS